MILTSPANPVIGVVGISSGVSGTGSAVINRHQRRLIDGTPWSLQTSSFELPDDGRVAVLEVPRTSLDDQGQPFRLVVGAYSTDRNQFDVEVGQVPGETDTTDNSGRNHA